MKLYIKFLCFLLLVSSLSAQIIRIELDELTTSDDASQHLTILTKSPESKLILPPVDTSSAKFFTIFYTWDGENKDATIDVMTIQKTDADYLYIDLNNDENLTNDNSPFIFPLDENNFYFDIPAKEDVEQKTRIVIQRHPDLPDSLLYHWMDKNGNLKAKFAKFMRGIKGDLSFNGKKGSFYFDKRVALRRGILRINNRDMAIALFDCSNDGLFNDKIDVLMIDLNGDGKLFYSDEREVFNLNDVFTIGSHNYKIHNFDKYGKWIELTETDEKATFYFLKEKQEIKIAEYKKNNKKKIIDRAFWDLNFTSLNEEKICFNNYKGRFLLLNFWGEWCAPCVSEIPDLIDVYDSFNEEGFQLISFIKTGNLENVKKMIATKKIEWPQINLTDVVKSQFKIRGYPTNILIFPNGIEYIEIGQINKCLIESYLYKEK